MTSTNLADLPAFADALRKSPVAANKAAAIALDDGAKLALKLGRRAVLKRLQLDSAYVDKQMSISKRSSRGDLLTKITAQRRSVLAPRFGARQKIIPNRTNRKHHKGDALRGIPKGSKAGGSTAWSPIRGGEKKAWRNAFFIRGRNSNALIMVVRKTRDSKSKLRAIYGSSVDEVWRDERENVAPVAMARAAKTFQKEFRRLS